MIQVGMLHVRQYRRQFRVYEELLQKDEEVCDDDHRHISRHIQDWVIAPSRYCLIPGPCYRQAWYG
jgi:hypothetical protein